MMHRIQWYALRFFEKIGVAGLLAIVTSLICLSFVVGVWLPTKVELNALALSQQNKPLRKLNPVVTPAESLQHFYYILPKISERSKHIQTIMSNAKTLNLVLDDVSYKTEQPSQGQLVKTYIDFTVYCNYPEMRVFLNNILSSMPYVSLDQLSINRKDTSTDEVMVRMRLTLHLVA